MAETLPTTIRGESIASLGVGGVNGLARTWVSTGPGKISGSALDSRASARRFLSSRQEVVIGGVTSIGKVEGATAYGS